MRTRATLFGLAAMLAAAVTPASGAARQNYNFYDCVGPAGTPPLFTAQKTSIPPASGASVSSAAAFHLTDGSAVFVVLTFGDGNFSPPGIGVSGNATTSCSVDTSIGTFTFSGILVATP